MVTLVIVSSPHQVAAVFAPHSPIYRPRNSDIQPHPTCHRMLLETGASAAKQPVQPEQVVGWAWSGQTMLSDARLSGNEASGSLLTPQHP